MRNADNPKTSTVVSPTAKQNHSVMDSPQLKPPAAMPGRNGHRTPFAPPRDLSTVELVKQITSEVGHLAQKQIELAKAELKADLKSEATMVGGLSLAAVGGICTLNLLLVAGVLALATVVGGWVAGLIVSGITLLATVIVAVIAWGKRVRSPMARTRRTLREDVQWTKRRLV